MTNQAAKSFVTGNSSQSGGANPNYAALSAEDGWAMIWRMPTDNGKKPEFLGISATSKVIFRKAIGSDSHSDLEVYHAGNTTKASDGTLKVASPVARIASPDSTLRPDIDESDFEWCGYGVANGEAHGIEIIREDVGIYRVKGAKSLAASGWRLLPPRDPNGSGDLGIVEANQDGDSILVTLFKLRMVLGEDGDIEVIKGNPIDVPVNSWIDIRMDMPEPITPPDAPVDDLLLQSE